MGSRQRDDGSEHGTTYQGPTKNDRPLITGSQGTGSRRTGDFSGEKILERDKRIATDGDQVDIDPETTADGRTKLTNVESLKKRSNKEGQGVQPPAPPTKIAENIKERNHVSKTLALLSSPQYDKYTNIVSAFGMDVIREDFERLQTRKMLNEGSINWMMRWWSSQVNGRFGSKPPPPQVNPHMPRCFFANTFWYTRMTSDGVFSYDNVERWTKHFEILQHYDLLIIPINIPIRNHWVLAFIDFKKKNTVIYDSIETDTLRPDHPEIHAHLLSWLTREHQARNTPFDAQDWKTVRGQQRGTLVLTVIGGNISVRQGRDPTLRWI
jgi:Ulp1 family protease